MPWQKQFHSEHDHIQVIGYLAASEAACRRYFRERVAGKVAESDGTEELRSHLIELGATGFDLSALAEQVEASPRAKDWEVGEAFAEVVLEDEHGALFPWPTAFDKRSPKASLQGPDLVGFHRKAAPRFVFGEVKSTSEQRVPPQVVHSGDHCLKDQMQRLCHSSSLRQTLIEYLLVRTKETAWEEAFNEALENYASDDLWLAGVLVSGGREPNEADLTRICAEIGHKGGKTDVSLLGFYLPFPKADWPELIAEGGTPA